MTKEEGKTLRNVDTSAKELMTQNGHRLSTRLKKESLLGES